MSAEKLITDHIDIWTSAVQAKSASGRGSSKKRELYGIKKLRELILELAVRGKLVPQDPTDEPASVLLERIAVEKAQLVKEKKIKKPKALSNLSLENLPALPDGWAWAHVQDFTEYVQRGKGPKYADKGSVRVVSQKCVQNSGFDIEPARYVEDQSLENYQEERYLKEKDLLWNSTGTGTVGRVNVLPVIESKSLVADSHVTVLRPLLMNSRYIWCFLMSPGVQARINPDHEFSLVSGSTKQVELNTSSVVSLPVSVAPLNEQRRIVAKVDELMALCDQLEQQTEASLDAHQVLVETLLATLTNSQNATELMANWARISEHFDTLFTTEPSIDQLKQAILQLAVMGKLVPQDPNDEPAAKLLERIAEEKAQLVKEKKIKKQKALPPIADDEKPFELPVGWEWCRLDDICQGITSGSTPPKSNFQELPGIPYLKVYNIRNQLIDFEYNPQFIDIECHSSKLARSVLYPGDVVMNIVGPPLGKIALIPDSYPEWNCNQAITFFRPIEPSLNRYIYTYLTAGTFLDSIELIGTAGQDNISVTKSRSIVLPTPPLEEQSRIVRKVNDLLKICDQLKQRLRDSQQTQLQLTDAIVEQAV
ncbi:restriction endonuclease subunit S [Vibrio vulnificus]|uniref:restriction endonuclease subunit S n=1 Tax=Vibrio vulnificus TaxID=672 RepID=UPI0005F2250B|nr:restriction endonuclease subunit S [Vibrio vulnificus]EHU9455451.1 restriction endonuclease subunit S [Vibrio vulnificus]EJA3102933.1 restriction endonuclease subunit S [Vibrio vulnificus]